MSNQASAHNRRDRELRRREWLMIYLPLTVGSLLALTLVVVIGIQGFRQGALGEDPASVWGDTAAIIVILEACLFGLILLIIVLAGCALVLWFIGKSQPLLKRGQDFTGVVSQKADALANRLVSSFIAACSLNARLRGLVGFRRRRDV